MVSLTYAQRKVPDLKEILQNRGLGVSGNKADLIARLEEDDKKRAQAAGEDEIDWDDDDNKAAEPAPAPAPAPAAAPAAAPNPPVQSPKATTKPTPTPTVEAKPVAKTAAAKVSPKDAAAEGKAVAAAADAAPETTTTTKADAVPVPEAPKVDYTLGVEATDAEKEAEKRAARAKKFGIVSAPVVEDEQAKKLAERAKKFGLETSAKEAVVSGLDSALPERKLKRGREDRQAQGGRNAKRQTPDRRTEPTAKAKAAASAAPQAAKKAAGRILDDPAEKAKAEARAKKFGQAPKA